MTPQHYIQQTFPKQKEQLNLCFKVLNFYLSAEDVKIFIDKRKSAVKTPLNAKLRYKKK
jgi:hypothetical protein